MRINNITNRQYFGKITRGAANLAYSTYKNQTLNEMFVSKAITDLSDIEKTCVTRCGDNYAVYGCSDGFINGNRLLYKGSDFFSAVKAAGIEDTTSVECSKDVAMVRYHELNDIKNSNYGGDNFNEFLNHYTLSTFNVIDFKDRYLQ